EAREHLGLHVRLKQPRLGVGRDVFGGAEVAEGSGALGVRVALRDSLAVEVSKRLDEVHVVQQQGPVAADRQRIAVGGNQGAGARSGGSVLRSRGAVVAHEAPYLVVRCAGCCWHVGQVPQKMTSAVST